MSAPVLHVIACAHGTHDAAGRDVIDGLRADLAALLAAEGPGAQVHEAYVDVQSPSLDEVVAALPPGEPAVIVPLLIAIVATIAAFRPLDRLASGLLWPYLAWVAFATLLNGSIWWLNR